MIIISIDPVQSEFVPGGQEELSGLAPTPDEITLIWCCRW